MYAYDFLQDDFFNQLRDQMGAPLVDPIPVILNPYGLTSDTAVMLSDEFEIPDLTEIKEDVVNGTLLYKGARVTLNIRDIASYTSHEPSLPKIHIAFCQTLEEMKTNGRYARYVVSSAAHMKRKIQVIQDNKVVPSKSGRYTLNVCKHCLAKIKWQQYHYSMSADKKNELVRLFDLKEFFKKYPQTFDSAQYQNKHTENNQPINQYTQDWPKISKAKRNQCSWHCEECRGNFVNDKGNLHVHHINGSKYDNSSQNLRALCHACHAKQPYHEHML